MKSNLGKMSFKTRMAIAAGSICLVWGSIAAAAPPASVAGTWNIVGNQSVGQLALSQPTSTAQCKPISGWIYHTSNSVRGYYCPATGRISFSRNNPSGVVIQAWVGNVSDVVSGSPHRMGGTFHALNNGAGSGLEGEYHFQGSK